MKYLHIVLLLSLASAAGCKKDKRGPEVVVTIVDIGGYGTVLYTARVENPDPKVHSFLCDLGTSSAAPKYSCVNFVYFRNMPADLAVIGKKVSFSRYKDHGQPAMLSSVNHAHELDVYDAVEAP